MGTLIAQQGQVAAASSWRHLHAVLEQLPRTTFAFAYGSGVMVQPGLYADSQSATSPAHHAAAAPQAAVGPPGSQAAPRGARPPTRPSRGPQLDLILAVDDPVSWHAQNLRRNASHYSWLGRLGPQAVAGVADHVGVGVHFNPLVQIHGQMVKYGVLSTADLLDDLHSWRRLYVAGRLHKPVVTLVPCDPVERGAQRNHWMAALTALLLLPPRFTTADLLRTIVGLSYQGDVRVGWAEDPHKVDRIVAGSQQQLQDLYLPLLRPPSIPAAAAPPAQSSAQFPASTGAPQAATAAAPSQRGRAGGAGASAWPPLTPGALAHVRPEGDSIWQRDMDGEVAVQLLAHLPPAVLAKVAATVGFAVPESHCEAGSATALELAHAAFKTGQHKRLVSQALRGTVWSSSLWQAASGALAAGPGRAYAYVSAKLGKALKASAAPGASALKHSD